MNEGKTTESFRLKIQELELFPQGKQKLDILKSKIESILIGKASEKMTMVEMDQAMSKMIRKMNNLQSYVITELEKLVSEDLKSNAEQLLSEYVGHIQSLLQDNAVHVGTFDLTSESFILGDLPDASELIEQHKRKEKEKVGEEWVENTNKKIYKPWTWFQKSGQYKGIYETREYVDGSKVMDEFIKEVRGDFFEAVISAQDHMNEESERLKTFFLEEMNKLELVIKQKVLELRTLTGDSRVLEERIRDDRMKMKWLQAFILKLDTILEI